MTNVFVSYSQKDRRWLGLVRPVLDELSQSAIIKYFVDDQLKAGDEWRKTILGALDKCDVAVLLLTPQFFESEFITKIELPRIRSLQKARRILVIPIFVSGTVPKRFSWIGRFQSPVDPKHQLDLQSETDQQRVAYLLGEKIKLFAFGNTKLRRLIRRRIINWRFSGTVIAFVSVMLAITVLGDRRFQQPKMARALSATAPISECAAENATSAVQLFEKGWLIARFETDQFYAVGKRPSNSVGWIRIDASGYTKGGLNDCPEGSGNQLLGLGFRWFYCGSDRAKEVRELLGEPLTGEVRVWLQYQSWLDGLLVYGVPSTVDGVTQEHFQILSGLFLRFDQRDQGTGGFFGFSTDVSEAPIYCSAIWHPGHPGGRRHERHEAFVQSEYCQRDSIDPKVFIDGLPACALDGYPQDRQRRTPQL
ncbi:MAG: toll/interleukin-1 receptor domain-containing protein [Pseudomonadota bacterium]